MKLMFKLFLLAVTLTTVQIGLIESKRHRGEDNKQCSNDICNLGDNCILKCFCDTRQNLTDCLVFNGNMSSSSNIWESFTPQPYLQTLSLRVTGNGSLKEIPTETIRRLNTLRNLTIKFSPIKQLRENAFANSMSLKGVYLIGNQITKLDLNSVSNLPSLATLNLEENEISELQRGVFVNLPNLKRLSLSYNNLTIIHERCFNDLTRLTELNLHANDISTLTRENFQGLIKLESLDLSRNELKMLGNYVFAEMKRLKILNLAENKLEMISEMALSGLLKLEQISLENNRIQLLDSKLFEGREYLTSVDLRFNQLKTMTNKTIASVINNIIRFDRGTLYLDGNQLACDCSLSWAHSIHRNTANHQLRQCVSNITCYPDRALSRRLAGLATTTNPPQFRSRAYTYHDNHFSGIQMDKEDSNQVEGPVYHDEERRTQIRVVNILQEVLCPETLRKESSIDEPKTKEVRNSPSSNNVAKASLSIIILMFFACIHF